MALGKGTYFAKNFALSSQYALLDLRTRLRSVFLCRVLTGCYTVGSKSLKQLPFNMANGARFHSAVNKIPDPNIFAVFHDAAAIPVYLITFYDLLTTHQ